MDNSKIAIIIAILLIASTSIYTIAQQLVISTDKPTYTLGDTITITGNGPAGEVVAFVVLYNDKALAIGQLPINADGSFSTVLPQLDLTIPGTHTLTIVGSVDLVTTSIRNTSTFILIVPTTNITTTNTTPMVTTVTTTVTKTVTETQTITEIVTTTRTTTRYLTKTITETLTNTTTVTETSTVTKTTTVEKTVTKTQTATETKTLTKTKTETETTTVTETETVTTINEYTKTVTTTMTVPAPFYEKAIYLIVGLLVGAAIIYAVRIFSR